MTSVFSKQTVGTVRGSIGLVATFCRHRRRRILLAEAWLHARRLVIGGIVVQAAAIAAYASLAFAGASIPSLRARHGR